MDQNHHLYTHCLTHLRKFSVGDRFACKGRDIRVVATRRAVASDVLHGHALGFQMGHDLHFELKSTMI